MNLSGLLLTTTDIGGLPMEGIESSEQVATLCRKDQLWGYKENDKPFARWKIPVESFAIYLLRNPELKKSFELMYALSYTYWKECDSRMAMIVTAIKKALNIYSPSSPQYGALAIEELSKIFNLPKNQIEAMFLPRTQRLLHKKKEIPVSDVIAYLKANPLFVDALYQRRSELMNNKDPDERYVGHLIMLYEYYASHNNSQNLHIL